MKEWNEAQLPEAGLSPAVRARFASLRAMALVARSSAGEGSRAEHDASQVPQWLADAARLAHQGNAEELTRQLELIEQLLAGALERPGVTAGASEQRSLTLFLEGLQGGDLRLPEVRS